MSRSEPKPRLSFRRRLIGICAPANSQLAEPLHHQALFAYSKRSRGDWTTAPGQNTKRVRIGESLPECNVPTNRHGHRRSIDFSLCPLISYLARYRHRLKSMLPRKNLACRHPFRPTIRQPVVTQSLEHDVKPCDRCRGELIHECSARSRDRRFHRFNAARRLKAVMCVNVLSGKNPRLD